MRNKFYRIVAIFIAMNLMSATVFAAEDASFGSENTSEPKTITLENSGDDLSGGDQNSGSQNSGNQENTASGSEESGQSTGSSESGTELQPIAPVTPADPADNKSSEEIPAGSESLPIAPVVVPEDNSKTSEGGSKITNSESASEGGSEITNPKSASEGSSEITNPESASEGTSNAESTDEETRRTAQKLQGQAVEEQQAGGEEQTQETAADTSSEEASGSSGESGMWSNDAEIKDVMGLKVSNDGESVVISYKTKHSNPWDYSYQGNPITITYGDGTTKTIQFDWDGNGIHGDNWSNIGGATVSKSTDQSDTEIATITIPASYFDSMEFTLSSGEYQAEIDGAPIVQDNSNAVYEGISLDGTFNDWNAVQKSTLNEPDGDQCVEEVAWVIESDYVFIYLKDDGSNSATWAGPNHNGKYAITTDLGRTLVFQLTEDGAVVGAEGAVANHTGSQWEIAIPTSSLPNNNGGLSFGLYLSDTTLDGYGDTLAHESTTDIKYDGLYGDWDNYPHKEIQYATAGTQENVPDGEAAIYVDNNVYGHCETRMQAHLDEKGGEYTQGVSIIVNDDWSHALQMRLATVDSAGNINWNPAKQNLENGSYEYYIFDVGCWGSSQNINNLVDADVCYGKAMITLTEGRHDMEWYVDSNKLAARYGLVESDLKKVSSQYVRIGPEVVTSAGTSTGPLASAGMCVLSALVPFVARKKFTFGKN